MGLGKSAAANRSVPPDSSCPSVLSAPGLGLVREQMTLAHQSPVCCRSLSLLLCLLCTLILLLEANHSRFVSENPRQLAFGFKAISFPQAAFSKPHTFPSIRTKAACIPLVCSRGSSITHRVCEALLSYLA